MDATAVEGGDVGSWAPLPRSRVGGSGAGSRPRTAVQRAGSRKRRRAPSRSRTAAPSDGDGAGSTTSLSSSRGKTRSASGPRGPTPKAPPSAKAVRKARAAAAKEADPSSAPLPASPSPGRKRTGAKGRGRKSGAKGGSKARGSAAAAASQSVPPTPAPGGIWVVGDMTSCPFSHLARVGADKAYEAAQAAAGSGSAPLPPPTIVDTGPARVKAPVARAALAGMKAALQAAGDAGGAAAVTAQRTVPFVLLPAGDPGGAPAFVPGHEPWVSAGLPGTAEAWRAATGQRVQPAVAGADTDADAGAAAPEEPSGVRKGGGSSAPLPRQLPASTGRSPSGRRGRGGSVNAPDAASTQAADAQESTGGDQTSAAPARAQAAPSMLMTGLPLPRGPTPAQRALPLYMGGRETEEAKAADAAATRPAAATSTAIVPASALPRSLRLKRKAWTELDRQGLAPGVETVAEDLLALGPQSHGVATQPPPGSAHFEVQPPPSGAHAGESDEAVHPALMVVSSLPGGATWASGVHLTPRGTARVDVTADAAPHLAAAGIQGMPVGRLEAPSPAALLRSLRTEPFHGALRGRGVRVVWVSARPEGQQPGRGGGGQRAALQDAQSLDSSPTSAGASEDSSPEEEDPEGGPAVDTALLSATPATPRAVCAAAAAPRAPGTAGGAVGVTLAPHVCREGYRGPPQWRVLAATPCVLWCGALAALTVQLEDPAGVPTRVPLLALLRPRASGSVELVLSHQLPALLAVALQEARAQAAAVSRHRAVAASLAREQRLLQSTEDAEVRRQEGASPDK